MRIITTVLILVGCSLVFATLSANASEPISSDLQETQNRIDELERRVEDRRLHESESSASGSWLSSMIETTDFNGWAAASYNINAEGMHNNAVRVANPGLPFHTTSNTFQVDQVVIEIDNAATGDSRAGAHVAYQWGVVNGAGTAGSLHTAYVSYLAPLHTGVQLDVGLLPTLVGAEVTEVNGNFNISRGLVWAIQPVTNVGALASSTLKEGWTASIGVLNDPLAATLVDTNNEKAVTAQLAHSHDDSSASASVVWGEVFPGIDAGWLDIVVSSDALGEDVSAWFNYTFNWADIPGGSNDVHIHGLAAAARKQLCDDLGLAFRAEALLTRIGGEASTYKYSLTLTPDYALTDHLTLLGEARMDIAYVGSHDDGFLPDDRGRPANKVAAVFLAQLLYEF